jgi:hypothetical protein
MEIDRDRVYLLMAELSDSEFLRFDAHLSDYSPA